MRLQKADDAIETGYPVEAIAAWASRIRTWLGGDAPSGLPHLEAKPLRTKLRDIFVYFVHKGIVRAPAAAMALIGKLAS